MQTLRVNGYDMAYLEVRQGPPLVCVHGSLCDFRVWSAVLGPLTRKHRVIAVSLRHFFPSIGTASATPIRSPSTQPSSSPSSKSSMPGRSI
jgi:pimeloyl-ACP methyl ester carboxylesterase